MSKTRVCDKCRAVISIGQAAHECPHGVLCRHLIRTAGRVDFKALDCAKCSDDWQRRTHNHKRAVGRAC